MATLFLIGFMGCGKTTLGAALAAQLGATFIDLDDYIEERCEASVKEIFARVGESGFREIERQALIEVAKPSATPCIVACGGGTPCYNNNMALINDMGISIWLTTTPERIAARLCLPEQKIKRPLIAQKSNAEILSFVKEKLAQREPYYAQAQLHFDATAIETPAETRLTARQLASVLQQVI